jgi:diguanylate cyclase (GGDEF)-like protein
MADIVRLSQHDGLTGLFNHTCCYRKIDAELKRYARYNTIVSLLMIDIDNFKAVNDQYGHQEGDRILAMLGAMIEGAARESDICCRYGGEEFVVVLPSTATQEAGAFAERLRAKIEQTLLGGQLVTVSIGVASCNEAVNTPRTLVEKADAALYEAKRGGKNRVALAPAEEDSGLRLHTA